jgi:hypothetical protein
VNKYPDSVGLVRVLQPPLPGDRDEIILLISITDEDILVIDEDSTLILDILVDNSFMDADTELKDELTLDWKLLLFNCCTRT